MNLSDYFEKVKGVGVLSTADSEGHLNAAIYSRPHFLDEGTAAFIAADRLTHANLQTNPSAVYLFKEDGAFAGKRLYLTKIREEKDSPLIDELRRRHQPDRQGRVKGASTFLLYFRVDQVLPLIGGDKE